MTPPLRAGFGALTLAALLSSLGTAQAADALLSPQELAKLPPPAQKEYVLKRVAEQRLRRQVDGTDVTPPVLTKFSAAASAKAGGAVTAKIAGTDDLSGISDMYAYAYGVSGHSFIVAKYPAIPSTKLQDNAGGNLNKYTPAGDYTFEWAYIYDRAGNYNFYDGPALAALGNVVTQVSNASSADSAPPQLIKGSILTPKVSMSATHPGTSQAAFAGVQLQLSDSGEGVTSGVSYGGIQFCKPDLMTCIWVNGSTAYEGQGSLKMTFASQPGGGGGMPTGTYLMYRLYLYDYAGNYVDLRSIDFGGETDFSLYFPSTTIKLTP